MTGSSAKRSVIGEGRVVKEVLLCNQVVVFRQCAYGARCAHGSSADVLSSPNCVVWICVCGVSQMG